MPDFSTKWLKKGCKKCSLQNRVSGGKMIKFGQKLQEKKPKIFMQLIRGGKNLFLVFSQIFHRK
jgi:hypothetical protein